MLSPRCAWAAKKWNADVEVRPATLADLAAVARVQAKTMVASSAYANAADEEEEFRRLYPRVEGYFTGQYSPSHALPERAMFVAEAEGEVIGFIAGNRSTRLGCNGELQWMFVLPEWQRRGVGTLLLGELSQWFIANGTTRVIIDAPPANPCRAFYIKHGAEDFDAHWLYWPEIGQT
jgi:GNAT superfamily N-acetyltransferase